MNTDFIKGVVVPILTPIDEDEMIDEARLREHVDYVIDGGVLGILAFGSNGEFYVIEEDEMERGLKIMVDQAAGRVRYILESAPSAQRSAAVWQRWQWQTVRQASPCCSRCF